MEKYRDWSIYDDMPEGWVVDKTAGAPAPFTIFITNGKSIFSGEQQRALLRVRPVDNPLPAPPPVSAVAPEKEPAQIKPPFPAKSANDLARARAKAQLLRDIQVDLTVCELEGWDKLEYIRELQALINSFFPKKGTQTTLF